MMYSYDLSCQIVSRRTVTPMLLLPPRPHEAPSARWPVWGELHIRAYTTPQPARPVAVAPVWNWAPREQKRRDETGPCLHALAVQENKTHTYIHTYIRTLHNTTFIPYLPTSTLHSPHARTPARPPPRTDRGGAGDCRCYQIRESGLTEDAHAPQRWWCQHTPSNTHIGLGVIT
jgi:hypothetical protein